MFKQCKATDANTLANFSFDKLIEEGWYWSIKYDGNYVQIKVEGGNVISFTTSGGKQFWNEAIADAFGNVPDGIYECEYLGTSKGRHGDRGYAAVVTTMRTEFAKGIKSNRPYDEIRVFDYVSLDEPNMPFSKRQELVIDAVHSLTLPAENSNMIAPAYHFLVTDSSLAEIQQLMEDGWEGVMLKAPYHIQREGKRVKDALKYKMRKKTTLTCIDIVEGKGKYGGMVGALLCQDELGVQVSVGSGLNDEQRSLSPEFFIGKSVAIAYESFKDTYIQPVVLEVL